MSWYYHKEYAPHGKLFEGRFDVQQLADSGWVDSPAKIGIVHPMWDRESAAAAVQKTAHEFEMGRLKAISDPRVASEKEAALLAQQADEIQRIKAELKRKEEELASMRATETPTQKRRVRREKRDDQFSDLHKAANPKRTPTSQIKDAPKIDRRKIAFQAFEEMANSATGYTADGKPDLAMLRKYDGLQTITAEQRDGYFGQYQATLT